MGGKETPNASTRATQKKRHQRSPLISVKKKPQKKKVNSKNGITEIVQGGYTSKGISGKKNSRKVQGRGDLQGADYRA